MLLLWIFLNYMKEYKSEEGGAVKHKFDVLSSLILIVKMKFVSIDHMMSIKY